MKNEVGYLNLNLVWTIFYYFIKNWIFPPAGLSSAPFIKNYFRSRAAQQPGALMALDQVIHKYTHNPTPKKKLIFFRYHDRWKLVTGNYFTSLGWIWNLWCLGNWWLSLLNNLRMETTMSHRMLTRELQEFKSMIPYDSTHWHIFSYWLQKIKMTSLFV